MNRIVLMVLRNFWRIPYMWWKLCHYAKHTDEYPVQEKWNHIRRILSLGVSSGNIELQVHGQENIPEEDGFMMYANHQGMFDVLAIAATCERPLSAVLKKELAEIPFLKQIRLCTNSFAMDREDIKQSMTVIMDVIKAVKKGQNVLIFPEGTRSRLGNKLVEFHRGSFKCATKTNCVIVPVAFVDCFKVLDQKGCKPVTVQIHYLKPIYPEEYKGMNTQELAEMVKGRIAEIVEA